MFWLLTADPQAVSAEAAFVDFSRPACEAFKAHGVRRVVRVSALGRGWLRDTGYVSASLRMDDLIASTGVSYRALTCPSLMANLLRQIDPIKNQGLFFAPTSADLKAPKCSARAVAAELLLDRSWSGVAEVPVLGSEPLSSDDMARIMSDFFGPAASRDRPNISGPPWGVARAARSC